MSNENIDDLVKEKFIRNYFTIHEEDKILKRHFEFDENLEFSMEKMP